MRKVFLLLLLAVTLIGCNEKEETDPYTHYDQSWQEEFNGLNSKVTEVVTSNDINGVQMVGIKLELENAGENNFLMSPNVMMLTLSTGETIDGPFDYSPTGLGGTIAPGAIITSNINFDVRTNVNDLEWVQFHWYVMDYDAKTDVKESYAVKLELN